MQLIGFTLIVFFDCILCEQSVYAKDNYYAFQKADNQLNKPPKVRKPPYIPMNTKCPGLNTGQNRLSPKHTLCGDLNLGYIPQNPMGQQVSGQPYPFETIKNKTLHFLANTLPVLKQRMHTIPKVAKLFKASDVFENSTPYQRRFIREVNNNSSLSETYIKSAENTEQNGTDFLRQSLCEGNSICQAIESLQKDGPFSKTFLSNVVSAVSNAATIGNIASMVNQYGTQFNDLPQNINVNNENKSTISQVLSTLSTISGSNSYNPLISIIDYVSSFQNSNKFPSRRRKPLEPEDLLPEPSSEQSATPCPALEEYISPTYARNYQGIWKYVVQIPSEGYFTQTIQRTSCLKNKCDFLDGVCSESPRWVSLLVAEIFYPDVYFPVSGGEQSLNYNQIINVKNNHKLKTKITPIPAINLPAFADDLRRMDISEEHHRKEHNRDHRKDNNRDHIRDQITPRSGRKVGNRVKIQDLVDLDDTLNVKNSKTGNRENRECDGYDKIGCYVVRVYYDWFLVNGSCKCWRTTKPSQYNSINEAIKRIFIGKW